VSLTINSTVFTDMYWSTPDPESRYIHLELLDRSKHFPTISHQSPSYLGMDNWRDMGEYGPLLHFFLLADRNCILAVPHHALNIELFLVLANETFWRHSYGECWNTSGWADCRAAVYSSMVSIELARRESRGFPLDSLIQCGYPKPPSRSDIAANAYAIIAPTPQPALISMPLQQQTGGVNQKAAFSEPTPGGVPSQNLIRHWTEIETSERREPLIEGVVDRDSLVLLYGPSNVGKSAVALNFALSVALKFEGSQQSQSGVVYFALEGGTGIVDRVRAWAIASKLDPTEAPFFVCMETIDFLSSSDIERSIEALQARREIEPIQFIVVDTLSRAIAGADENSPKDMGQFVRHLDQIRGETGATILVVHHAGKDTERGARGHSLLRAAVDTEIEVKRADDGLVSCIVTKQRHHPTGKVLAFRLEGVRINDDGEETAIVAIYTGDSVEPTRGKLSGHTRNAFEALQRAIEADGETIPQSRHTPSSARGVKIEHWRRYFAMLAGEEDRSTEALGKAFKRAVSRLRDMGRVGAWGDWVWMI